MKKLLLPFALVACGPTPQKVQTAVSTPPAPPVATTSPAPVCKPFVLWQNDPEELERRAEEEAQYAQDYGGAETPEQITCAGAEDSEVGGCISGEGGHTRDEKLAALNQLRKDEGVCDTRHRYDLEASILAHAAPKPGKRVAAKGAVANTTLVSDVLALTPSEKAQLARDGMVVPDRLSYDSYTSAYYDVHRGQMPLYVSVDSIMHAVYASHDKMLAAVESSRSALLLDNVLGAMHCGLAAAAANYPPEVADDLDLYLTVARTLLSGESSEPVPSVLGHVDKRAEEILSAIRYPEGMLVVDLFGRDRKLDTTAFTPRGHYVDLPSYFQAAMWISRIELNLVSRDTRASTAGDAPDPRETPREGMLALALADLVERTGASKDLAELDASWGVLAGKREDVSIAQLLELRKTAGITTFDAEGAAKLRAAIGNSWKRTVNTSPTVNVENLPAIATMLGARITPDTVALGELIAGRGPASSPVEIADMLGFDRARKYIEDKSGDAVRQRAAARATLASAPLGGSLYGAWLSAIMTLAHKPEGATPSFMDQPAFEDMRLDTALASYGQLRHNHVLVSAQAYDQGGCEIPDGYVEPAPATYMALAAYAHEGAETFKKIDPQDTAQAAAYFQRLERLMKVLAQISREELANQPLSEETKRFLSMIVEERDTVGGSYSGTFPIATFDGWYLDLFTSIDDALENPSFIADVATFSRDGAQGVHYLGAKKPRLGVFNVDTGGGSRLMVGPVARAFEYTGPLESRATDEDVEKLAVNEPWSVAYSASAPKRPAFAMRFERAGSKKVRWSNVKVDHDILKIVGTKTPTPATIELLDHHFTKLASIPVTLGAETGVKLPAVARPVEAVRVRIGNYSERFDVSLEGHGKWTTSSTVAVPRLAIDSGQGKDMNIEDDL